MILDKKNQIIIKSRELLVKYGYNKVSMEEIAKCCGYTKKTLYSYFESKDELVSSVIEYELQKEKKAFEKINKDDKDIIDLISEYLYKMLKAKDDSNSVINIFKNINDYKRNYFFSLYDDKIVSYISELIAKEIRNGTIRECNTDLTAFIIYNSYKSVILNYDNDINDGEVVNKIVGFLKHGIFENSK